MKTDLYFDVIHRFKICDEYESIKDEYDSAISKIKMSPNIFRVFQLEKMLKNKNMDEIRYAIKEGFRRKCDDYTDLFEKGVDETINISKLHSSQTFLELSKKINNTKSELMIYFANDANDTDHTNILEQLFEIYNNVNYELLKIAYTFGYEFQKSVVTIQFFNSTSVNQKRQLSV